jgi:hypothetical protein
MSAYYPLMLSGSSLVVCFWAEVSTQFVMCFVKPELNLQALPPQDVFCGLLSTDSSG